LAANPLGKAFAKFIRMKKICSHLERRSQFLQALLPLNPREEIRLGWADFVAISGFVVVFAGLFAMVAK
jgi:hypothetical protein